MDTVLAAIDSELARLHHVRALLSGEATRVKPGPKPGKKYGVTRTISVEGRARIAAAQKARWAKKKKAPK